ncbi:MAG: hypothetical protein KAJ79_04700, partial [Candidatus Omnitrophica bacterium]|nr:hypothetical protein [Candidatus Omnitrophota bacterium]
MGSAFSITCGIIIGLVSSVIVSFVFFLSEGNINAQVSIVIMLGFFLIIGFLGSFIGSYLSVFKLAFLGRKIVEREIVELLAPHNFKNYLEEKQNTQIVIKTLSVLGINKNWDNPAYIKFYRKTGNKVEEIRSSEDHIGLTQGALREFLGYEDKGELIYTSWTRHILGQEIVAEKIKLDREEIINRVQDGNVTKDECLQLLRYIAEKYTNKGSKGRKKLYEYISFIETGKLMSGVVKVSVWKRDPYSDLGSSKESASCRFLGGKEELGIIKYLKTKSIVMLYFDTANEKKKIKVALMAGTCMLGTKKESILLVDGLKGSSKVDKEIILTSLEDYAIRCGFSNIFYNTYYDDGEIEVKHLKRAWIRYLRDRYGKNEGFLFVRSVDCRYKQVLNAFFFDRTAKRGNFIRSMVLNQWLWRYPVGYVRGYFINRKVSIVNTTSKNHVKEKFDGGVEQKGKKESEIKEFVCDDGTEVVIHNPLYIKFCKQFGNDMVKRLLIGRAGERLLIDATSLRMRPGAYIWDIGQAEMSYGMETKGVRVETHRESFRRYIFYPLDKVNVTKELKVPGDEKNEKFLHAYVKEEDFFRPIEVLRMFGEKAKGRLVEPIVLVKLPTGIKGLYNGLVDKKRAINIIVYEHYEGRRLNNVTPDYVREVAENIGKDEDEIYSMIAVEPLKILSMVHCAGFVLNGNAHYNNFMLTREGMIKLVSGWGGSCAVSSSRFKNWFKAHCEVPFLIDRVQGFLAYFWWQVRKTSLFLVVIVFPAVLAIIVILFWVGAFEIISEILYITKFIIAVWVVLLPIELIVSIIARECFVAQARRTDGLTLQDVLIHAGCNRKDEASLIKKAKQAYYDERDVLKTEDGKSKPQEAEVVKQNFMKDGGSA